MLDGIETAARLICDVSPNRSVGGKSRQSVNVLDERHGLTPHLQVPERTVACHATHFAWCMRRETAPIPGIPGSSAPKNAAFGRFRRRQLWHSMPAFTWGDETTTATDYRPTNYRLPTTNSASASSSPIVRPVTGSFQSAAISESGVSTKHDRESAGVARRARVHSRSSRRTGSGRDRECAVRPGTGVRDRGVVRCREARWRRSRGRQSSVPGRGGVQKSRLVADPDGIGVVKSRYAQMLQMSLRAAIASRSIRSRSPRLLPRAIATGTVTTCCYRRPEASGYQLRRPTTRPPTTEPEDLRSRPL